MITLGEAIKFDHTKKAKSLTGGIYVPILSNYRAKKAFNGIQDIFNAKSEEDKKLNQEIVNTDLVLRQIIYTGLFTVLGEGRGKELEQGKALFKEFFFFDFDETKHFDLLVDEIKKLDKRIVLEKPNDSTMSLADVVEWVEVVRDKGAIDRQIALYDFKSKYETALIMAKKNNDGRSN